MHRLESDQLVLKILPERGAKIAQLFHKSTRTELLSQPATDSVAADVFPGIAFDAEQAWGWDEMFPAIAPETFDAMGRRITVPDHGEVWALPWRVAHTMGRHTITVRVAVPSTGYELTRETTVTGATVRNEYTLKNVGRTELPWIWAAHPLFSLNDGAELHVPPEWNVVRNAHDSPAMPEYNKLYPFPGSVPNLGVLPAPDSDIAFKYYFEDRNTNHDHSVVLSHPSADLGIRVQADPRVVPWYGIWCNAGGLFGHNNVAIEPASAPMDSLSAAKRLNRLPYLPAGESVSWWMTVSLVGLHEKRNSNNPTKH